MPQLAHVAKIYLFGRPTWLGPSHVSRLTIKCAIYVCSRAVVGWLGAGLGGRWRAQAWSGRGASRFGQCGRARNRRGAVAGRQNGPALHATRPLCVPSFCVLPGVRVAVSRV